MSTVLVINDKSVITVFKAVKTRAICDLCKNGFEKGSLYVRVFNPKANMKDSLTILHKDCTDKEIQANEDKYNSRDTLTENMRAHIQQITKFKMYYQNRLKVREEKELLKVI